MDFIRKLMLELNISKPAIGKWEADKLKPRLENLLKMCDNYETNLYELLDEATNVNLFKVRSKVHSYVGYAENLQ